METNELIQNAIASILNTIGSKSANIGIDKIKEWIEHSKNASTSSISKEINNTDELATAIFKQYESKSGQHQFDSDVLSRWLEIPEADMEHLDIEDFNSEVLIQHIILEQRFKTWFEEWGYEAELGEILRPANMPELECSVDVYGTLPTIHGTFEVAVNFVCDNPPDENRVIALASKIGAYADSKESFGQNDVFMIVTPWSFTPIASANIRQQNKQRTYCVLGVDGAVLHDLESAEDVKHRLEELYEAVTQANQEAKVFNQS
ncbi:MAG: hypothetical protein IIA45_01990 [Bacteroidetes bacterium]|nr:hypothetical protein [Bacteroidota bacterium]